MSTDRTTPIDPADAADEEDLDPADLRARAELLAEENRRLREEYARARRSTYRRSALGMAAIGALSIGGGIAFPASRAVLFSLGAIGLFGALLTYYLTPERFVAASVGEAIYDAVDRNGEATVSALGLADHRVYVPLEDPTRPAVLFVPQQEGYEVPSTDRLDDVFVVPEADRERGVALQPTGQSLFAEFERVLTGPLAEEPGPLGDQLSDALVHEFELADGATPEVDADGGGVAVAISGGAFGDLDRFDHPIPSFLAVGFAVGLGEPVETTVGAGDSREDLIVTCSWETRATGGEEPSPEAEA